jgi:hypothetical protein
VTRDDGEKKRAPSSTCNLKLEGGGWERAEHISVTAQLVKLFRTRCTSILAWGGIPGLEVRLGARSSAPQVAFGPGRGKPSCDVKM